MHVAGSGQRDVSSVDIVSVILDDIITVVTGEFRYFFPTQALFKTFFASTLFGNRKYRQADKCASDNRAATKTRRLSRGRLTREV